MKKLAHYLSLAIMILTAVSCSDNDKNVILPSKTYVLVHGAWQAPWVWGNVKSQLEARGQTVVVVELPAHGRIRLGRARYLLIFTGIRS